MSGGGRENVGQTKWVCWRKKRRENARRRREDTQRGSSGPRRMRKVGAEKTGVRERPLDAGGTAGVWERSG